MKKIIALLSVLILAGCSLGDIFTKEPEAIVDAWFLGFSYIEADIDTSSEFDDKYIQVTGIVSFSSIEDGEYRIQLYGDIICIFNSKTETVENIQTNTKVVFNGTVEGLDDTGGKVILSKWIKK